MSEISFREFGNSAAPWLPDQPFWQQNAPPINELTEQIAHDYPHTREAMNFDPSSDTLPPEGQRRALWAILMGRQHGNQQDEGGEKVIVPYGEPRYTSLLEKVHWGEHRLIGENALSTTVEYDMALNNCGTAVAHTSIERTIAPEGRLLDNLQGVAWLSGQRLRGTFAVPGEDSSPQELIELVGQWSGQDMDRVVSRSARLRDQLARRGEGWNRPFGNESDIVELTVSAHHVDQIDWKAGVEITPPAGQNEPIVYRTVSGEEMVVPPREYARLTYPLKDGRKIHIFNGPAVARTLGDPRATSASIAKDALQYMELPEESQLVGVNLAPHIRGAADTGIAFLDAARKGEIGSVSRFDLANGPWCTTTSQSLTAALGELMATMKADYRLRAVLRSQDPNSPELMAL